jgi:ssDNA-binding Zn-finger/Zn-ribbon topoisomerase 1
METASVQPANATSNDVLICEKCGAKLILRTATRGANAGNQFYGCSNYPQCNFTVPEDELDKYVSPDIKERYVPFKESIGETLKKIKYFVQI